MVHAIERRFGAIRALVSVGLFAIGLMVNTAAPSLAQSSGTWMTTGSLNTARVGHTATLLPNGQVLAAGGQGTTGFLTSAELYNPATSTWTVTGSMATPRASQGATLSKTAEYSLRGD